MKRDLTAGELEWSENIYLCIRQKYVKLRSGSELKGSMQNIIKKQAKKRTEHFAIVNGRFNPEETVVVFIIDHANRLEELVRDNVKYGAICTIQMKKDDLSSYCTYLVFAHDI